MRIGLFSDTYLPTTNGISYVLFIMQKRLEELGHEVYIFAPATNLRAHEDGDNDHIVRFPAVEGRFYDEQLVSVFFPYSALKKIKQYNLDIIHFFSPAQIGLLGAYAAIRLNIPLVSQYSTDIYRYVEQYKSVIPGTIAFAMAAPFILRLTPRETIKMLGALKPQLGLSDWQKSLVAKMHVTLHDQCDAVIALSQKMYDQLESWGSQTPTTLLPTGVDEIEPCSKQAVVDFRKKYGLKATDKVLLYVGRPSREKNLDLLIDAFDLVAKKDSLAKLLIVGGGFDEADLRAHADQLKSSQRIIFTGRIEREKLGAAYVSGDIFVFPSMTDTQGLVLNEAAGAGLPLAICDPDLAGVFIDGQTGLVAKNSPQEFAKILLKLIDDKKLRQKLGQNARRQAAEFTETGQMKKLVELYEQSIMNHRKIPFAGGSW